MYRPSKSIHRINQMSDIVEDRIRGLLYGLAIGDQIGGPIQMALQLSNAILDKNRFDEKNVLRHYYTWWREAGFDTGTVTHNVFMEMKRGNPNSEATATIHRRMKGKTGGCNPMHRASPLALLCNSTAGQLDHYAKIDARLTHLDAIAGECSAFVVKTCHYILAGSSIHNAITQVYDELEDYSPLRSELIDIVNVTHYETSLSKPLSTTGYSPEVLRAALFHLKTNEDFESTIESVFEFAGSNNYCPVVAGTIAGTYYGYSKLPQHNMKHDILITDIDKISNRFMNYWK